MTEVNETPRMTRPTYSLQGTLLEACSCGVLCPCWIGADPDGGECFAFISYHIDSGEIEGVDVSGLSHVAAVHIPGNVLAGNWEVVVFQDAAGTDEQRQKMLAAFGGDLGGPLGDLAQLVGTIKGVEKVQIQHEVRGGAGSLSIAGILDADIEPFRSADGTVTTLRDSVFSTVPGSPAYVSRATHHRLNLPQYGMTWEFEGRNAVQSDWRIEHTA